MFQLSSKPNQMFSLAVGLVTIVTPAIASQPIFGGPAYDSITGIGYANPTLPIAPGTTAGPGAAVGYAQKFFRVGGSSGPYAVRWDSSGADPIELQTLGTQTGGFTVTYAYSINSGGMVVGAAQKFAAGASLGYRAVRWDALGVVTELGNIGTTNGGFTNAYAYALNDANIAVGYAGKFDGNTSLGMHAVRWDTSGNAIELDNLYPGSGSSTFSYAYAINSEGTAVGYAKRFDAASSGDRAVRWDASGTAITELASLGTNTAGFTNTYAYAINNTGTAVGYAQTFIGNTSTGDRAVRWGASGVAATELGNLGLANNGVTNSRAMAINTAGMIVGYVQKYNGNISIGRRAVRWNPVGTDAVELENLGTNGSGSTDCFANSVNDAGIAVGSCLVSSSNGVNLGYRAVAWNRDGSVIPLNNLLSPADAATWTLTEARSISNTNWITGYGTFDPDGVGGQASYTRMFLIKLPPSCPTCAADYDNNGGVDGGDLASFFADFEAGEACADVDNNGGVDGGDLAYFFTTFEAGGC